MANGPDITKSYIPMLTTISIVMFVAASTYVVTNVKNDVDRRLEKTAVVVKELAFATKELAEGVAAHEKVWWSRNDMILWCQQQAGKLPDLACPQVNAQSFGSIHKSTAPVDRALKKLRALKDNEVLKTETQGE